MARDFLYVRAATRAAAPSALCQYLQNLVQKNIMQPFFCPKYISERESQPVIFSLLQMAHKLETSYCQEQQKKSQL